MLIPDVVEYLDKVKELGLVACGSPALEHLLAVHRLQVVLGILNVQRAEVASDLVLCALAVGSTREVLICIVIVEWKLAVIAEVLKQKGPLRKSSECWSRHTLGYRATTVWDCQTHGQYSIFVGHTLATALPTVDRMFSS